MEGNIKDKVDRLLKLQEIELKMASIQVFIDSHPGQLKQLDSRITAFEDNISEVKSRLSELQQSYRSHESDAQTYQAQIEKSREKLKLVKTNKEYQSSLKEIEEIEELQSKIEDKMIQCLEDTDAVEAALAGKKEELKRFSQQVNTQKEEIQRESAEKEAQLSELDMERKKILQLVAPELLNKYNAVKNNAGGIGVAVVKNSVCQGCNVNIPPQMFNELLKFDKLLVCPFCQRIIYPISQ